MQVMHQFVRLYNIWRILCIVQFSLNEVVDLV
jgi:hypothetical protein